MFLLIHLSEKVYYDEVEDIYLNNFLIQKLEKLLTSSNLSNNYRIEGHRFLGDQYDYSLNIDKALDHYQKATDIYKECPENIRLEFASTLYTNFSDYYLNNQQIEC